MPIPREGANETITHPHLQNNRTLSSEASCTFKDFISSKRYTIEPRVRSVLLSGKRFMRNVVLLHTSRMARKQRPDFPTRAHSPPSHGSARKVLPLSVYVS
jgi:hypothetical protein